MIMLLSQASCFIIVHCLIGNVYHFWRWTVSPYLDKRMCKIALVGPVR